MSTFDVRMLLVLVVTGICCFFGGQFLYRLDPEPRAEGRYDQVGGWLILILIGFVLSPLRIGYELIAGFTGADSWNALTSGEGARSTGILYAVVGNMTLITLNIFAAIAIWKCRTNAPMLATITYVTSLVLYVGDVIAAASLFGIMPTESEERTAGMKLFWLLIWVPYLWISNRSRETFTKRFDTKAITRTTLD